MLSKLKSKLTKRNEQGFTIIEVVLVLAIAGLIFLVVFLAVPQLQRSQRDSQRTSDLGRMMTSLENYAANNNGRYVNPTDATEVEDFVANYLERGSSEFADPSTGETYEIIGGSGALATIPANEDIPSDGANIYFHTSAQCAETEGSFIGAGARQVAVMVEQENGVAFCQDNN